MEAITAIVSLVVGLPSTIFILWKCFIYRSRGTSENIGFFYEGVADCTGPSISMFLAALTYVFRPFTLSRKFLAAKSISYTPLLDVCGVRS